MVIDHPLSRDDCSIRVFCQRCMFYWSTCITHAFCMQTSNKMSQCEQLNQLCVDAPFNLGLMLSRAAFIMNVLYTLWRSMKLVCSSYTCLPQWAVKPSQIWLFCVIFILKRLLYHIINWNITEDMSTKNST